MSNPTKTMLGVEYVRADYHKETLQQLKEEHDRRTRSEINAALDEIDDHVDANVKEPGNLAELVYLYQEKMGELRERHGEGKHATA